MNLGSLSKFKAIRSFSFVNNFHGYCTLQWNALVDGVRVILSHALAMWDFPVIGAHSVVVAEDGEGFVTFDFVANSVV